MKQNQLLFRPFPGENPSVTREHGLSLNSNCSCPPCHSSFEALTPEIAIDHDLDLLRAKSTSSSSFIMFLNELYAHSAKAVPSLPMLDTVVFSQQGAIKYVVSMESGKLKMVKLGIPLKNFINERKYQWDLEYQKKKHQRQNLGFSFTQLDHMSQKLIKQFENNIKFTNPLLNRTLIMKNRNSPREQILTAQEVSSLFGKIQRKLFDFSKTQYLQVFPIMYGEEQNSYCRTIKYFRNRECNTKNFKTAEHYASNWLTKNETIEEMEHKFMESIKSDEGELLMYLTYKLFIFFQLVTNKQVTSALLSFITNDNGFNFYLKNIETLEVVALHHVQERNDQLPKRLQEYPTSQINLASEMKLSYEQFQKNYLRLEQESKEIEEKQQKDIQFSNQVFESLGYSVQSKKKGESFINSIDSSTLAKRSLGSI